jgi:predicted nucleotidyltransferase
VTERPRPAGERNQPSERVRDEVVGALAQLSAVREIASFGSMAEGRADVWSDVDLLVACEDVGRAAWLAAAAIRAAKPVLYYRMFTGVAQPSGRYWFEDEEPFNRLDVSFYSAPDLAAVRRSGLKEGLPMVSRTEYTASSSVDLRADARLWAPWPSVVVQPEETANGRALYVFLESLKGARRGRSDVHDLDAQREALEEALGRGLQPIGLERLVRRALVL